MEKYKRTLQFRLICAGIYSTAVLVLLGIGLFSGGNAQVNDFIAGYSLGLCIGIDLVVIFYIRKYIVALRNEEMLKKLYISENDERIQMIGSKAGSSAIAAAIAGLLAGGLVAGYFNEIVFWSLIGAALFVTFVFLTMRVYYCRKYSD